MIALAKSAFLLFESCATEVAARLFAGSVLVFEAKIFLMGDVELVGASVLLASSVRAVFNNSFKAAAFFNASAGVFAGLLIIVAKAAWDMTPGLDTGCSSAGESTKTSFCGPCSCTGTLCPVAKGLSL